MKTELQRLCRADGIRTDADGVTVTFSNGRMHRVTIEETESAYELTAIIARNAVLSEIATLSNEELSLHIWRRNRTTNLVGFHLDPSNEQRRRFTARAWVPKAGLVAAELQHYLRRVALEADRFEYILTGRDVE